MDPSEFPRVTPSLLAGAATMCPRRLRREFEGRDGGSDPFLRARVRERFLAAARDHAHPVVQPPRTEHFVTPVDLVPEEAAVFERCAETYVARFGDEPAAIAPGQLCERPTVHMGRQVRIGGWVDLVLERGDGRRELRQLDFWGRTPPPDPLTQPAVRVALLRLARWAGEDDVLVRVADLVGGGVSETTVPMATALERLRGWFDEHLAVVRSRIAESDDAVAGSGCAACRYIAGCPAHPAAATASRR